MKTRRGKVGEQIATKAQEKVDVAIKDNKKKKIAKARAPANAKAQKHTQQVIASSTLRQTHMRHSISSLRDSISAAWIDTYGMHTCNDEGERVPKTWPELDRRQQAVVSGALKPLLMPGNDPAFSSN
jgi:hypothetical protein